MLALRESGVHGRVELLAGPQLVEALRRVGVDDAPVDAGRPEPGEARARVPAAEPVDPGRHAGPDHAAVHGGLGAGRVRDHEVVEVGRFRQRRGREAGRAGDAVGAVRHELLEAGLAHVDRAEGRDDDALERIPVRVHGDGEDRLEEVVGTDRRDLMVDPLEVPALGDEGLGVEPAVAGRLRVEGDPGPVGNDQVVAAVGPAGRAQPGQLGHLHGRPRDRLLVVEGVDRPAHVDGRERLRLRLRGCGGHGGDGDRQQRGADRERRRGAAGNERHHELLGLLRAPCGLSTAAGLSLPGGGSQP